MSVQASSLMRPSPVRVTPLNAQWWQPPGMDWQPGWAFVVSGAEPVREDALHVHVAARHAAALRGSAAVLRAADGGWREVARYTASI